MTIVKATWAEFDESVRIELLDAKAPRLVSAFLSALPLKSIMWHSVISGENIGFPLPFVYTDFENPEPRVFGSMYIYANGQLGIIPYGKTTEPGDVNVFGRVLEEDHEVLISVGQKIGQRFRIRQDAAVFLDIDVVEA